MRRRTSRYAPEQAAVLNKRTDEKRKPTDHASEKLSRESVRRPYLSAGIPEIQWNYVDRIPAGEYQAISRSAKIYFDKQFKRWVCAVQFDVVRDSTLQTIARLTWFLNLGPGEKPRAGRRSKFWSAWIHAKGGPPKRHDRLGLSVFVNRLAKVVVEDTSKKHDSAHLRSGEVYSVIRTVLEWETGGSVR